MIEKYCDGKTPKRNQHLDEVGNELENQVREVFNAVHDELHGLQFHRALDLIWSTIHFTDEYIEGRKPWGLAKDPANRALLEGVLYNVAETLRHIGVLLYPFMPHTAKSITEQLGLSIDFTTPLLSQDLSWGKMTPGSKIHKGPPLFPRIEPKPQGAKTVSDATTPPQPTTAIPAPTTVAPQTPAPAAPASVAPPQITIDEFQKIQLKTAKVLTAERVPKSEKLLKLQVSLGKGTEPRQIVAGIGKKYTPDALIGKTIIIVANLKPAKLMGIESQGMVLAAGDSEVSGLATIFEEVDPGTKVK
jgi:methionyl-tRNA synthetase